MGILEQLVVRWPTALLALFPVAVLYFLRNYKSKTIDPKQWAHFPQPELPDPKRGHWPWIEKAALEGTIGRSFDVILYEQYEKLGRPPALLLDWRPVRDFVVLFIFSHALAEQVTRASKQFTTSMPKDPSMQDLAPLVGARSLVTLDGDEWKDLRKRILPGFQPQHLLTLVKPILDKAKFFIGHLERKAASGEEFRVDELTTNLSFDVIGAVSFDMDLKAQSDGKKSELLTTYQTLSHAFAKRDPFSTELWLRRYFSENERTIRRLDKKLDGILKDNIIKEHAKLQKDPTATLSRSVAVLSLTGIKELTPAILQQTSDACRGFLFAGHDTTSILMQWVFYELHRSPAVLKALRDELDEVFGTDPRPSAVMAQLMESGNGERMARLKYTDAIIKETLRLYPPGTTARQAPKNSNTTLSFPDGSSLVVDGLILSPRALIIQRDPAVYGEETRDDFVPDRWLPNNNINSNIPDGAWRPYERGPRRCTGSELANLQVRVVLACVGRWFDFEKVGLGELERDEGTGELVVDEKGFYKTKSLIYNTDIVTAKPVDGMKMKVHLSERAKAYV